MPGPLRLALLLVLALLPSSASAEDSAAGEFFEKRIRPLLADHCLRCHGAPGEKVKGKLRLTDRAALLAGGESGPAVIPGNAAESPLIRHVKHDGDVKMPPGAKLSAQQIADLTRWVKDGAVWPATAAPVVPAKRTVLFTAEETSFWAFQPLRPVAVPSNTPPGTSPIDAFIRERIQKAGLAPAPPADRRTRIRRATFDLTGLPPTPEEVDAFVADESPDAWTKVIDRLLASPAYGERWGRHWLDVARYADSNGLDENTSFGNAWRYRDYVIRAFNTDKPFDRFVKEQLAGDLLPDGGNDGLIATGFLVLGPKVLAEPDKQKMVMDIVDEQIDVVSKAFLGLTISCARCHDHKFDPVPTRDYYSLAGIFKSTKTMATLNTVAKAFERPLSVPESEEVRAYRAEVEQLNKELKAIEQKVAALPESDRPGRAELKRQAGIRRDEISTFEAQLPPAEMALAVADEPEPADVKVHLRGNHLAQGEVAPRIFPRIVAGMEQMPVPSRTSGRRQLAEWIASRANPLTARVIVNRVWQHHFGEGIVRSPDNFGRLGDRPTHPELLDWLALQFIDDGWSLKKLHRRIMTSATYQQSSAHDPKAALVDPENTLLARFNRRRLEVEVIRDAMLAVSGTLDRTPGGSLLDNGNFEYIDNSKSQVRYGTTRRSIYLPVIRNNVYDFFQAFDFVEPHVPNGKRATTIVAPQALFMLNNPLVIAQSRAFAEMLLKRSGSDKDRVGAAYVRTYGRPAKPEEVERALGFMKQYEAALESTESVPAARRAKAWQAWCHALYAANEFVTVE